MKERKDYTEYVSEINAALADENLTTESRMTVFSWIKSLKATLRNCRKQWREQPQARGSLVATLYNFWVQWRISAYLYECMESRFIQGASGIQEKLGTLPDGNCSFYSELMWFKNKDALYPVRMETMQVQLMLYNAKRNPWLQRRVCAMDMSDSAISQSLMLNHDEFYAQTEIQEAFCDALNILIEGLPQYHYKGGRHKLVAKPWTMMQAISVFGTTDEIPELLMNEPVLIVPYELINGKSMDDLGDFAREVLERAEASRDEKSSQYRYEGSNYD